MAPFCLLAEVNEEIYPGPTRGESKSRAASAPLPSASSPLSPGFTLTQVVPMPGFVCPTGFLSLGLTEVAVRLETKYSSFLVSELSDTKTAQCAAEKQICPGCLKTSSHRWITAACSWNVPGWKLQPCVCKALWFISTHVCEDDTSLRIHTCKQTSVLKTRGKFK